MKEYICRIPEGFLEWSNESIISYMFIQAICSGSYVNEMPISIDMIVVMMYGDDVPRKARQMIDDGISELINNNVISGRKYSSSIYMIECNSCNPDGRFAAVSLSDVIIILRSEIYKKLSHIKYLSLLMISRSSKLKNGKVCNLPIKYFADKLGVSSRTIMRYNEALSEINVIYILKPLGCNFTNNKEIYTLPNIYGRYVDKEYIDAYVDEIDLKKYRMIIKKKKLSKEEITSINEYVKRHNELQLSYASSNTNYIPLLIDEFRV